MPQSEPYEPPAIDELDVTEGTVETVGGTTTISNR